MQKNRQVYIASGWFTPQQEQARIEMLHAVWAANMTYFSPKDENLAPEDASESLQDAILKGNCAAIDQCRFVIASLVGRDMGTMWEVGYALGKSIPVMFYQGEGRELEQCPQLSGFSNRGIAKTPKELSELLLTVLSKSKRSEARELDY